MKIFTSQQIRQIDEYTINNEPIASINLMERASLQLFRWINSKYQRAQPFIIFAGLGNNGGDGLALARILTEWNYSVRVVIAGNKTKMSPDCNKNLERLLKTGFDKITNCIEENDFPEINNESIIVDAIFGSGLTRPLSGFYANLVDYINSADKKELIALDIPSGLFGEDNSNNSSSIIKADFTLSFQFPKLSFMFAENQTHVGNWEVLPIGLHPVIISDTYTPYKLLQKSDLNFLKQKRNKFSHKGNFGHVLLIAGSIGKAGAAVLASKACLRSGCGLLTSHVPEKCVDIIQTAIPEAMVSVDQSSEYFSTVPDLSVYDVVAIGPGIAKKEKTRQAFNQILAEYNNPMVIDADGLNIIAENKEMIKKIPQNSILTPHPGEFQRLVGKFDDGFSKMSAQIEFSKKYKLIVVLKGAYTSISMPSGQCFFNETGNPGMATAGSGDVLTGIIAGMLAQGFTPDQSAIGGVYIHGLSGDIAKMHLGEKSLIAGDIIDFLGKAFLNIIKTNSSLPE
jgi:ADP-dependent NAD(P)H-hydrate dehydratase / NAD(P)H-hydrate epimerase